MIALADTAPGLRSGHDLAVPGSGDAVCGPHGAPKVRRIVNRTDVPAISLPIGSRERADVVPFLDAGPSPISRDRRPRVCRDAEGVMVHVPEGPS